MTADTSHSSPGVAFCYVLADAPRLLRVDPCVMALLGFRPEAWLDASVALTDRIHPGDADLATQLFAPVSVPWRGSCHLRVRCADGRIICVRADHGTHRDGDEVLLDLVLHDARALPRTMERASSSGSLAAMLENADDFIYFKDRNHVFTGASQSLLALCTPPPQRTDLLGLTDYDVFPEAYADIYYRLEKDVFAGAASVREIQAYQTRDGRLGWVDNRKYPIRNAQGEIIGLYGIARDITAQRQAEAALEEERQRLQLILDNAPIGIWLQDGRGRMRFVNKAFCAAMGIPEAVFLSVPHYAGLIPAPFFQQCLDSDARALASDGISETVQRLPFVDGKVHDLRVLKVVKRDQAGAPEALMGLSLDITETLRQEQALRDSEQRFRSLFENTLNIAVQGYDLERRVIFWNQASELLYGYTREEAMGQRLEDLIIPEATRGAVITEIRAWAAGGPAIPPGELTLQRKDGSPVTVYSSHVLQAGAHGPEMYCLDIDLTERKHAEWELAQYRHHLEQLVLERTADLSLAKEAAEAASRSKSTFLANMSHELRTPMSGIIGMLALATRRMEDAAGLDHLDKARQAADHLLAVLNDILDISKIEAEHLRLEEMPLELGSLLDKLVSVFAQKVAEKGLFLNVEVVEELARLPLHGDPLRLSQILINLAGNAIKFTERGGVTVRARIDDETPDAVRVRIEVSDSGIGIDPVAQTRLFNAFEQADNSMTRRYGGTGLGLAISKRLVKLMGGEIGVDSSLGRGSTFWFTVCLARNRQAPCESPVLEFASAERQIQRDHANARILLAEDEPINREVALSLLEDLGIRVEVAEDGLQALNMARERTYALILMDMQMPQMNGVESALGIRANSLCRDTPILAMTANVFDEDRKACLAAGMNDFLSKPVEPERLFETMLKWLNRA
ncbi:MAG: PAS domain S-box protein [Zoogloea sp.]|uniref:PAS domain S-box protein n=1 Tax=Zoogloea sp. TaxID=49181 RepID=UPI0026271734|nr:PAS domain S-box protein [Zoogloea sp.]MDD2991006.1 PAS domain S-box protein [Zoogloea sp.]